jgi:hypothetical protein
MKKTKYSILKVNTGLTYNIPLYLDDSVDEMGIMVGFDGEITQVEEFCNFSYTQTASTVQVYNTVFVEKFRYIKEATFTINWGDGTSNNLPIHVNNLLTTATKTYPTPLSGYSSYTITIKLDSPWTKQELKKIVKIPQNLTVVNPLGTFSGFTIPYTTSLGSQDYLNDLDYTNNTGHTIFKYVAIGGSRIDELKLYGSNLYSGVTVGTDTVGIFSAYTIDNLVYKDYSDGYTMITGNTTGYTKEEVFNKILTRNEHFLGFIDEPTIYSDIFIERGKLSVMENNLRLTEIDNTGELEIYGNGFFNVIKQ